MMNNSKCGIGLNYKYTIYASYLGYITQAIVNNFAPLLFLKFARDYSLSLDKITLVTTINFAVQLLVDLISAKVIDKIGYRVSIVAAHAFAALGLIGLAVFPAMFVNEYAGIIVSVVLYAIGGGIIEVLISPIVEACPTKEKESAMSLLHSFYCWGHVAVVVASSVFFLFAGIDNWRYMAFLWALIPILNGVFFLFVPIYKVVEDEKKLPIKKLLSDKAFLLIVPLMVAAGASEQAMSQWASAFAESGLGVSKFLGDILGPCAFAVFMGTARAIYGRFGSKIKLMNAMPVSAGMCIICYLIAVFASNPVFALLGCAFTGFTVGIFWPGTFSIASVKIPGGGTSMYALLALAGDVGCSMGPSVVGFVSNACGGELKKGLIWGIIFPIMILVLVPLLNSAKTSKN